MILAIAIGFRGAYCALEPYSTAVAPAQVPSGFLTDKLGAVFSASLITSSLVADNFSSVSHALADNPSFNHFVVWLSIFNRKEYLLKSEPVATPSCLKYSAEV